MTKDKPLSLKVVDEKYINILSRNEFLFKIDVASALKKVKEELDARLEFIDNLKDRKFMEIEFEKILNKHFGVLDNPECTAMYPNVPKEKGCGKGFTDDYFNDDWTCGEIVGGQIKLCSDCSKEKYLCSEIEELKKEFEWVNRLYVDCNGTIRIREKELGVGEK